MMKPSPIQSLAPPTAVCPTGSGPALPCETVSLSFKLAGGLQVDYGWSTNEHICWREKELVTAGRQADRPTAADTISCLVGFEWDLLETGSSLLSAKRWKKKKRQTKSHYCLSLFLTTRSTVISAQAYFLFLAKELVFTFRLVSSQGWFSSAGKRNKTWKWKVCPQESFFFFFFLVFMKNTNFYLKVLCISGVAVNDEQEVECISLRPSTHFDSAQILGVVLVLGHAEPRKPKGPESFHNRQDSHKSQQVNAKQMHLWIIQPTPSDAPFDVHSLQFEGRKKKTTVNKVSLPAATVPFHFFDSLNERIHWLWLEKLVPCSE